MKITNRFKEICARKKIKQKHVAEHFGLTYAQVSHLATGKTDIIRNISAKDLADFLGVTVDELFTLE